MSSINNRVQVGHGVGGGNASIDNVAFSPGGWAGWLSDDEGFFANGADGWVCSVYDQRSKEIRRAVPDPSAPQYGAGMNVGFAGGGVWAGWLGAREDNPQRGLFTSSGLHFPAAGLLGVGPAGALAFKPESQSFGPSLVLEPAGQARVAAAGGSVAAFQAEEAALRAEGLLWQLSPGSCYDLQLLGGQNAIWHEGQRLRVSGLLPQPVQVGSAYGPRAYLIGGRWWVSYWSSVAGIVLHPFDELRGAVIVPPGVDMWHSARSFGEAVVFALFPSDAEQNGQLLQPLTVVDTSTVPLEPLAPAAPLELPAPTRKLWAGWFSFAPTPAAPGNAIMAVRNMAGALSQPAIVSNETEHLVTSQALGRFITGRSVEEIEAAAKASELRPVAYWDAFSWPRWPALPKGSWLCLQLYCQKDVEIKNFYWSARSMIVSAAKQGYPLVLVGQQYSSNASLIGYTEPSLPPPHDSEALKALAKALVVLAMESPAVVALLLFSGYGRRGGLMDHPDLLQPWENWSRKLQAPALEPWPPPKEPPKPPPDPPKPIPYARVRGVIMQTEQGWLIGPGDKVLAMDSAGRVSFSSTTLADADLLEAAPIAGDYRATVRPVAHRELLLTADSTKFTPGGNACMAYYGAKESDVVGPDGKPGFYQRWAFGQWDSGIVTAAVDYIEQGADNGRHWKAQGLTWVKKS